MQEDCFGGIMRRVRLDRVRPGSKLARCIYNEDGSILLSEGVEINETYIERLRKIGIEEIYIEDEISRGVSINEPVSEKTRIEARIIAKNTMEDFLKYYVIDVEEIKTIVNRIIDELLNKDEIITSLTDIKTTDDYLFEHSVNVCVLSLIIGIEMNYDTDRLRELGTGAFLHDIGKLLVPREILKKSSQLTVKEFEIVKKHTIFGYDILKRSGKVTLVTALMAIGHHERYDGSGYPFGLRGQNIHECSRIAAVADVYDALASNRAYRKRYKPNEIFEYLTTHASSHFDPVVIKSLVRHIALYSEGTGVLLNTKERAIVVRQNENYPTRPVIRIIYDKKNQKLANCREVDLSVSTGYYIIDTCEV